MNYLIQFTVCIELFQTGFQKSYFVIMITKYTMVFRNRNVSNLHYLVKNAVLVETNLKELKPLLDLNARATDLQSITCKLTDPCSIGVIYRYVIAFKIFTNYNDSCFLMIETQLWTMRECISIDIVRLF